MRSHGAESFIFEVLEECEESQLIEKEEFYIERYNSTKTGYNRSITAYPMSDRAVVEKYYSEEVREKYSNRLRERNKANWENPEFRERHSKLSSEIQKKRLENPEYRAEKTAQLKAHWEKKKKRVAQYTLDGELVKIYTGLRIAERESGISSIHKHIAEPEKRKQAGGFVWKYID